MRSTPLTRCPEPKGIVMPGLLRGMARTAVVAGTATAVSNRVSRRQSERWAAQDQAPYPQQAPPPAAAPASSGESRIDQLKELGALKEQGVLNDAEFEAEKARILG
jgi:Short C-terminal domain